MGDKWWLVVLSVAASCIAIYLLTRYLRARKFGSTIQTPVPEADDTAPKADDAAHTNERGDAANIAPSPVLPSFRRASQQAIKATEDVNQIRLEGLVAAEEPLPSDRVATASYTHLPPDILASIASISKAAKQEPAATEQAQKALQVHEGRLIHKIPKEMRVGVSQSIEVRIGADMKIPEMAQGIGGSGLLTVHNLPVVETMAIDLYSPDGAFLIDARSEREQLVKKDTIRGTLFESFSVPYGQWKWSVTPLRTGVKTLALRVSARLLDSQGHPSPHTLVPDREFTVNVRVNHRATAARVAKWIAVSAPLAVMAALFSGAIENDLWPTVRSMLIEKSQAARIWIENTF
jgi:hypothetical protein